MFITAKISVYNCCISSIPWNLDSKKNNTAFEHGIFTTVLTYFYQTKRNIWCGRYQSFLIMISITENIKMKHSLKLQRNSSSQVISKKIFCADLLKWTVNKVCSGQPEFRKVTPCADWELEKQTRELFPQKKRRRTLSHRSNSEHWRSAFMPGWGIQPLTSLTSPLERLSCNQKCCIAWLGSIVYRIV